MLTALLVLHNKKYSHHDIKPENIFLFREITHEDFVNINMSTDTGFPERYRGKLWLKLGDFGQTQRDAGESQADVQEDPADIMGGTRMYRPPEMIEGKSGSYPSDLYSVGVVMCDLVFSRVARLLPVHLTPLAQVQASNRLSPFLTASSRKSHCSCNTALR